MNKITDAILYRLKELRLRVSNLVTSKRFTEMSDDRAYSNGRMAEYDRDIAQAKANLASWYSQSPLELTNGDLKLIVESQDGYTFALKIMDFSRPGVLRSIAYGFTEDDRGVLGEYLGGRTVSYLGEDMQADVAFASIDRRMKEMAEEIGKLRREAREKDQTIANLNAEMEARYNDANR